MTPSQLSDAVLRSVRAAVASGELNADTPLPERVPLRRWQGQWATGIALRLAGPAGMAAGDVAALLRERLLRVPGVREVHVSGGGFLNVLLRQESGTDLIREILVTPRPDALPEDPARDVARWAAATGAGAGPARTAELTAELLVQREPRNPLFLIRYAHARIRCLERGAASLGVGPEPGAGAYAYPLRTEQVLLGLLGESAVAPEAPGRLAAVADAFLETERERPALPVGDEKPVAAHRARLALAQAAGTVLVGGLRALGISAPEVL